MSQQDRVSSESSDSAEVRPGTATLLREDTAPMIEYLFSHLCPHPSVEPVPLRFTPVASRAWSFLLRYYRDQDKREPPGMSPRYCDRCKP
jgi:hypothetical protein